MKPRKLAAALLASGGRIAYCAFSDRGPDEAPLGVITTVRPNGRDVRQVSNSAFFAFRPNWMAG